MKKLIVSFMLAVTIMGGLFSRAHAEDRKYMEKMGVEEAWKITRGSEDVVVAVLNTGVNYHLPEFAGRIVKDAEGHYGYDALTDTFDPMDRMRDGLGTKVASIIGGRSLGIAPGVKILPVRVFDENGVTNEATITRGLQYAIQRGARIVEFGGGPLTYSPAVCQAMLALEASGALLVAPAGNEAKGLSEYPEKCNVQSFVTAAAATVNGELTMFSNFGFPAVTVAAQGEEIVAIGRDGRSISGLEGTSFSSAITSAVAALVWSAHPEYSARDVIYSLVRGSIPTDGLQGRVLSNGYLSAIGAVQADPNASVR